MIRSPVWMNLYCAPPFNAGGQCSFTVLRYNPAGSLDKGFGDGGKVTTSVGGKNDSAESVVIQSDGKIVVAGYSFIDSNNNDFAVVRYNTNRTLDPTFNETGKATADFGAHDFGHSVAVHRDGRIFVAGYTSTETKPECALACFKANGSLDASFNGTGKVTTNFGGDGNAEGQGVTVQTDGKIVVAGNATVAGVQQFALARYNADGTLDTSFGGSGRVLTAFIKVQTNRSRKLICHSTSRPAKKAIQKLGAQLWATNSYLLSDGRMPTRLFSKDTTTTKN